MNSAKFFAIFIPIFSIIITTIFIAIRADKKPHPAIIKSGYFILAFGLLIAAFFVLTIYL